MDLEQRAKGKQRTPQNDTKAIWQFMNDVSLVLSEKLSKKRGGTMSLFNDEEYEHNSDDPLIELRGSDARNFSLRTGNVIGSIRNGAYTIKISSRFGDEFLKFIIADADGFLELQDQGGKEEGDGYEWLLIYLWLTRLKRASRLGIPKSYVSRTESSSRVQGRIDPFSYELGRKLGIYRCDYREHSYCNPATILISEIFRKLKGHSFLGSSHALANAFALAAEGRRSSHLDLLHTKYFKNPFYADYNDVIDLSKRILRGQTMDIGDQSDGSAYLFDVSMLFEYFIRKLLKRSGARFHLDEERSWKIPAARRNDSFFKLKPDLVFSIGGQIHLFDVKYKSFDFQYGVAREDLFQLHTYLGQCTNRHNVARCGFIYPITEKRWERKGLSKVNGCLDDEILFAGRKIPFRVQFLRVPDDRSKEFRFNFRKNCSEFTHQFS